jgi:hypothetical protein
MVYAETSLSRILERTFLKRYGGKNYLLTNEENIDFILSHFEDKSLFPRRMMTKKFNYQFTVYSKDQIVQKCIESDLMDCRINGYPEYTEYKGIIRQPPNFVFIDLDLTNFDMNTKKLELGLKRTLKKIESYNGFPTVLSTGNGYHIYIPISAIVLDQEEIFSKDKFPDLFSDAGKYSNWSVSEVFLKYAEIFFTNRKADPQHKPKYKSCLIRIPGSYNSKLLNKNLSESKALVQIIQKWDGNRIPIQCLLKDFRRWLVQEEYHQKLINNRKKRYKRRIIPSNTYKWIENLLQTPLVDHRKYCLLHILVPYLVNVKGLSSEQVSQVVFAWLSKCNLLRFLDFDPWIEIKNRIKYVRNFRPMSLAKLKTDNKDLYQLLNGKID